MMLIDWVFIIYLQINVLVFILGWRQVKRLIKNLT